MAAPAEARVTECPYCAFAASRTEVHAHMVDEHPDRVETWTDARRGRMHYHVECPDCGDAYEHRVKPRSSDPDFLKRFAREISMVAFDMLLNHVEAAHGQPEEGSEQGAPEEAIPADRLPAYGPGGGSARPGERGVPVPPGMPAPAPPAIPGHPRPSSLRIVQSPAAEPSSERPDPTDPKAPKDPHNGGDAD